MQMKMKTFHCTPEIETTHIVEDNAHNEEDLVLVPKTQLDAEPTQNKNQVNSNPIMEKNVQIIKKVWGDMVEEDKPKDSLRKMLDEQLVVITPALGGVVQIFV